ncbi:flavodoxin [Mycoplasma sp. P36-A1]|uniref:flavodoxin n=1 Tax=Mycoplasma sp. P36-A1 TaxID=3252900 RepID=UPI003C2B798A
MEKVLICYWSGTGNTEIMANAIEQGCLESADVTLATSAESPSVEGYDRVIFGCPSMGDEVLEESEFEPWFSSIETQLSQKKIALFGSYGWGDGQWMRDWEERVMTLGVDLYEPTLIMNYTPDATQTEECVQYGRDFMKY